jgi:hypothetical protein
MIADLAKLGARRFILGPLAGELSGALGSGAVGQALAGVFHDGGTVGAGGVTRAVPVTAFLGAPRMHSGGWAGLAADEVPAILQRGERVLSRDEARGYGQASVNVTIQARDAQSFRQSRSQVAADIARAVQAGAAWMSGIVGTVFGTMASVFFANCPGPCFRENQALADILRNIPDPDFMVVSVTCDPENDTPESLRRYADRFEADPARWKFLTGDMATIKEIANGTFLLPAEVGVHSERGVVFDREGRLRGSYHLLQPDRVQLLEKLIRDVLAEPAASTPSNAPNQGTPAG